MNNTECTRRIRARKAICISRTLAIMIRNNRGHLAQPQRVTERAPHPIQAALSPGDESTSVFPSRPECCSQAAQNVISEPSPSRKSGRAEKPSRLSRRTHRFASGTFAVPAIARDRRPIRRSLTIRAAILAAFCRWTVAPRMRTLFNFLLGHSPPDLRQWPRAYAPPHPKSIPHRPA